MRKPHMTFLIVGALLLIFDALSLYWISERFSFTCLFSRVNSALSRLWNDVSRALDRVGLRMFLEEILPSRHYASYVVHGYKVKRVLLST